MGKPILRHLAQDENKLAKKQGDKYSYHLGNIELKKRIEESALNKVMQLLFLLHKSPEKKFVIVGYYD